jgi:DNA-directed RNA polymerase specialized sigma24 family protein
MVDHTRRGVRELLEVSRQYGLTPEDVVALVRSLHDPASVPVGIFSVVELTPLEAIIKYLHERRGLRFSQIAQTVGRDQRNVAITYHRASLKHPSPLIEKESSYRFPLVLLSDRSLSAFEQLVLYLRKQELAYAAIAELTGRDQRTIWTIAKRAERKLA